MRIFYLLRRVLRWLYWRVWDNIVPIPSVLRLWLINRISSGTVTCAGGPVVSLTTYGKRSRTVYLAIESIGRGRMLPCRVILWLDEPAIFNNLPATIRRLVKRGLEVKLCENYGPHKKYYPYLESLQRFDTPLVTADDDVVYPRDWLNELSLAFQEFPDVVNCYRARIMTINERGIGKYENWRLVGSSMPSFCHVATGVGGVLYPPALLRSLKDAGNGFAACCLMADDVWLHVQAIRAGCKVRQIRPRALQPFSIPGTDGLGLWKSNHSGGNDTHITATYAVEDIHKLLASQKRGNEV